MPSTTNFHAGGIVRHLKTLRLNADIVINPHKPVS